MKLELPNACLHFPLVYFRPPIDERKQILTFVWLVEGRFGEYWRSGHTSVTQPHARIVSHIREQVGEDFYVSLEMKL